MCKRERPLYSLLRLSRDHERSDHRQHDLPDVGARFHPRVRGRGVLERDRCGPSPARSGPAASSGQTSASSAAAIRAFTSTDCGRRVEPVIVSRLVITCAKLSSAFAPAEERDHHQPPVRGQRAHVAREIVAADHVEDHVERRARRSPRWVDGDEVGVAVVDRALRAERLAGRRISPPSPPSRTPARRGPRRAGSRWCRCPTSRRARGSSRPPRAGRARRRCARR